MNEASVSAPLMKGLRAALEGAVVIKHADRSMIGMPDCSVTWRGRTLWLEFKLVEWKPWMDGLSNDELALGILARASKAAPAQRAMMDRLSFASVAMYVFWVKKTCVLMMDPSRVGSRRYECTAHAIGGIKRLMEAWSTVGVFADPIYDRRPSGN